MSKNRDNHFEQDYLDDYAAACIKKLEDRIDELETAITDVVTQRADNLCWLDVYKDLAALVGIKFDPLQLSSEEFIGRCIHFDRSLRDGRPYETDEVTKRIVELEKQLEKLGAGT